MKKLESLKSEKFNVLTEEQASQLSGGAIFPKSGKTDLGTSGIGSATVQKTGYWRTGWFSSVQVWTIVETADAA